MSSSRQRSRSAEPKHLECPSCGKMAMVRKTGTSETPDHVRVPNLTRWVCENCAEELYDAAAMKRVREARRQRALAA